MGSVIDYLPCKKCGGVLVQDFYYKTNECSEFCKDCGYSYRGFYRRNEEGNLVKKNEHLDLHPDNLYFDEHLVDNPFGSFEVKVKSGLAQVGTLADQEHYEQFNKDIREIVEIPENEVLYVAIRRVVNGDKLLFPIYKLNENVVIE